MVYNLISRVFIPNDVISTEMNTSRITKISQENMAIALRNHFSVPIAVVTRCQTLFTILYLARSLHCEPHSLHTETVKRNRF
jgi:hypothetical protein